MTKSREPIGAPPRVPPHDDAHRQSARLKGDRVSYRPRTLRGLLSWLQVNYALEAPARLHDRDVADDGAPDHTGEAKAYIGFTQNKEPNDWRAVACRTDDEGSYVTPMRCAIARIGSEERRKLLGGLACNVLTPLDVSRQMDLPDWAASDVMYRSLEMLWASYQEMPLPRRGPKSESQLDAEAA